jgi:cytochrome c-type biogenesis protein
VSPLLTDGSLLLAIPIAIAAGIVSFLSPCILPLVPGYLAYATGLSAEELSGAEPSRAEAGTTGRRRATRRIVLGTLGFTLGLAVVFVSFGALFGSFGQFLREHELLMTQVFGVLTILLGLLFAGVLSRVAVLNRDLRLHRLPRPGLAAAPVLGVAFALGWTPCIGPTLALVLGLAASSDQASALRGAVLSGAYCLGIGLPSWSPGSPSAARCEPSPSSSATTGR